MFKPPFTVFETLYETVQFSDSAAAFFSANCIMCVKKKKSLSHNGFFLQIFKNIAGVKTFQD